MKLLLLGAAVTFVAAHHPISQEIIDEIKAKTSAWIPHSIESNPFSSKSHEEIEALMCSHNTDDTNELWDNPSIVSVPASFDSRTQWAGCVHAIRDQASCGSCWAFAASEALSDRFCIKSGGSVNVVLSPEDMVECDSGNMGCNGGNLALTWRYLYSTGIVADSCLPYTSGKGTTGVCHSKCTDGEAWKKYKCASTATKSTTVAGTKSEIYANGPVETGFNVYADFMSYSSGVYHHVSGRLEGGHAVKIIGWGHDLVSGFDYWLCANSWGTSWGEKGFFRIKQGDSGIDDATFGCAPAVNGNEDTFTA